MKHLLSIICMGIACASFTNKMAEDCALNGAKNNNLIATSMQYQNGTNLPGAATATKNEITWETNYQQALKRAQAENKPIFLFFTGTDWCTYCKLLEKQILSKPQFIQQVGNRFVFVKLDFPMNKSQGSDIDQQNQALQNKYNIKGFPTVVILSPKEERIATTGYSSKGPDKYAEMLLNMIGNS